MPQQFRLDRPRWRFYLALGLAGCQPGAVKLVPDQAVPVPAEQVRSWVGGTGLREGVLHRFKWLYKDDRSSAGGRGSVRIAMPDSLRFDAAGPLGAGKSSAVIVGDSAVWFEPEDKSLAKLVPEFPLLWAMLGIARLPRPDASLRGFEESGRIAWQYASGTDTLEYLRTPGTPWKLLAEIRHEGKVVGRTEATLAADGTPLKARLTVPSVPAQLDLTFYLSKTTPAFPPDIWLHSQP